MYDCHSQGTLYTREGYGATSTVVNVFLEKKALLGGNKYDNHLNSVEVNTLYYNDCVAWACYA